jgi:uroporphyrinogen decarboxylase
MATGRERVEAALALDVADRPPVSAWGHDYQAEWDPARLARVAVERTRRLGFDFVKLQIRATSFAEAFGAPYRYSGDAGRAPVGEPPIREPEDWARLPEGRPLDEQVECLRLVVGELGPDVPVIQTVFSPITAGRFLSTTMLEDLEARPDLVLPALRKIARILSRFTGDSLDAGAAGVFYAITGFASADAMPLNEYRETVLPLDHEVLDACAGGWFNMLHLCGARQHFELASMLPVQCVSWQLQDPGNPGLAEARAQMGKAVVGGLHRQTPIADGSPEQVTAEAETALRDTGGRGHMLAPGCSVSPWPVDKDANFRALVRAASARSYDA